MFLAQILHESGGLRFKTEQACIIDGCSNSYKLTPGVGIVGKRYFGRGYIQLTWDYNYKSASMDVFGDDRLLQDPDSVATNEDLSWATAFWYWKKAVGSVLDVKRGYFGASTKAINGPNECSGQNMEKAVNRFGIYKIVMNNFSLNETPIENGCYN